MGLASFATVLRETRKLPRQAQTALAENLLSNKKSFSTKISRHKKSASLERLSGISADELEALANAILAPSRQRRLNALLRKNKIQPLSAKESEELDQILAESDRLALLKAKAE